MNINVRLKHTKKHTHTHTNNASGSFPLSLFLFDPASLNIWYLCPTVCAKVNIVPSKTSRFPAHLLTTRGPKHTETPVPTPSPSCSLSDSGRGKFHVYSAKLQSAHKQHTATWTHTQLLFSRPKPVTTLKCRVRLRFLIVHWFFVPRATLHGATISLPYFSTLHPSNSVYFLTLNNNNNNNKDEQNWLFFFYLLYITIVMFFYASTSLPPT